MATSTLTTTATALDVPCVPGNAQYVLLPPTRPHMVYTVVARPVEKKS